VPRVIIFLGILDAEEEVLFLLIKSKCQVVQNYTDDSAMSSECVSTY